MSDLDFKAFSKKYNFAINGLEMRVKNSNKEVNLAETLYKDAMAKKVNMDELTTAMQLFYQGNVFGQVKVNKFVEKYKI